MAAQLPLHLPALRRNVSRPIFVEYVFTDFIGDRMMTINDRMRELDGFRFYTPHTDELTLLHLANGRMNLLASKEILYLCGGLVGVRFESEDLKAIHEISNTMIQQWHEMEGVYKNIPSNAKKIRVHLINTNEANTVDEDTNELILSFHRKADEYIQSIITLQRIVAAKQQTIDRNNSDKYNIETKINADPESKMGSTYPPWYTCLKDRYLADEQAGQLSYLNNNSTASTNKVPFTIGKFSVFLAMNVEDMRHKWTNEQVDAMAELMEASKDEETLFGHSHHHHTQQQQNHHNHSHKQQYLARRFFNFLKAVPELKSTPKDEKALDILNN